MADGQSKRERERAVEEAGAPEGADVGAGLPTPSQAQAAAEETPREPRFSIERLRSPEGPAIVSSAYEDADEMPVGANSAATIGGAFAGREPGDELTRTQIRKAVDAYFNREDTTDVDVPQED